MVSYRYALSVVERLWGTCRDLPAMRKRESAAARNRRDGQVDILNGVLEWAMPATAPDSLAMCYRLVTQHRVRRYGGGVMKQRGRRRHVPYLYHLQSKSCLTSSSTAAAETAAGQQPNKRP